jgi:hypothetical protein
LFCSNERGRLLKQQIEVIGKTHTFDGNNLFLPFQLPEPVSSF